LHCPNPKLGASSSAPRNNKVELPLAVASQNHRKSRDCTRLAHSFASIRHELLLLSSGAVASAVCSLRSETLMMLIADDVIPPSFGSGLEAASANLTASIKQ
jgi:hypothetical protein